MTSDHLSLGGTLGGTVPSDRERAASALARIGSGAPSDRELILRVMADSKVDKWHRWFNDPIFPEVSAMHLHRYAFRTVREMVQNNDSLPPSYFFEYIEDTYAVTQSVAVRRQAESTSRVKTLGRLLREVEADAQRLTRDFWVGLWGELDELTLRVAHHGWETQWAGEVGDHLDPAIPGGDLERLTTGAEKVADYVDQYLAHRDARPSAGLPTFHDLDAAIDLIGELYAKYGNLLTASVYPILVPTIQHNWLAVFQRPWMPKGWQPPSDA
jgi:hypothetical protein